MGRLEYLLFFDLIPGVVSLVHQEGVDYLSLAADLIKNSRECPVRRISLLKSEGSEFLRLGELPEVNLTGLKCNISCVYFACLVALHKPIQDGLALLSFFKEFTLHSLRKVEF